jgi:F0F1-type ATP synthase assembly protein I
MKKPLSKPTKEQNRKSALNDFGKYSGMAFQMIAIILAGVFGGVKLDQIVKWEFPVFTLVFTILAVFMSMYYAVKDIIRFK